MSKRMSIVATVAFVILSWIVVDAVIYSQVRRFKLLLSEDNSRNKVTQSVGEPNAVLNAGAELPAWGGYEKKKVRRETWVYFVFPETRNRMVLTFEGDKLIDMEHQKN